ncbi:MAG TPA: hypothetical protein VJA47_02640 [archaeon]|nr:hypothetical protein [archaeon]
MFGILGFIVGILLIFLGGFMAFLFPSDDRHMADSMAVGGIVIGLVILLFGFILVIF